MAAAEGEGPRAAELAARLGLPLAVPDGSGFDLLLLVTPERLELHSRLWPRWAGVRADFVSPAPRRRLQRAGGEAIVRAVGSRAGQDPPSVLDATAGLGRDAAVLAMAGCRVLAFERSPVLVALVQDGLERARSMPGLEALAERLELRCGDAREWLAAVAHAPAAPDVVVLDPMHPERRKSALVRKEMRVLRALVGTDPDAAELLAAARAAARQRVVVKRPLHAPALGPGVSFALRGRRIRFDVYLTPAHA